MIILGLNGGISLPYENVPIFGPGESHDSAAALLVDGAIVSAIEEERLNRIKHTNKFPINAIKAVLKTGNIDLSDVDYFAYFVSEESVESIFRKFYWSDASHSNGLSPRAIIADIFKRAFDFDIDQDKIFFVDHHIAHASSAYYLSGFDKSLILTIDGVGENISGMIAYGDGSEMDIIESIPEIHSLGQYYAAVTQFLGYDLFDEYKVMGLAPYGDPSRYRDIFALFYKLLPEGKFEIYRDYIRAVLFNVGKPRRKGQKFDQLYKDVAASLQESLEKIILHILSYHKKKSGLSKLCLAGGVAHNCSANGKILYSGMFDEIFIQPASHDAGNSIGAAVYAYKEKCKTEAIKKLEHVYIGTDIEADEEIEEILETWESFVSFKKEKNIEQYAAELIAQGKIIGWVQGRSEFGPRALGNRSILADPRPAANKDIVNMMVKKREAYRPFAPSVIQEEARNYFDVDAKNTCFDYMTFVVNVKEAYRSMLGAITHVDGTARLQTVSKRHNPRYWELINAFGKITGVPILLNTSFNNNVEPIVNSAEQAIVCFLTTGLDYLVIKDYVIHKRVMDQTLELLDMVPRLLPHAVLYSKYSFDSFDSNSLKYAVGFNYSEKSNHAISRHMYDLLSSVDGRKTFEELFKGHASISNTDGLAQDVLTEIKDLWNLRYINLSPRKVNVLSAQV